jgi:hypothetical protein
MGLRPAPARAPVEPRVAAVPPPAPPPAAALQIGRIEVAVQAPPAMAAAPRRAAPAAPRGMLSGSALLGQRFGFGQS